MSSVQSPCRADFLFEALKAQGAAAAGVVTAEEVDACADELYRQWVASGRHAGMDYMEKYGEIRRDPRLLLEGARSLIVAAFPYYYQQKQPEGSLPVALYARGDDYHDVLRKRLEIVANAIGRHYGGATRVCIDTAPLRERYWAQRAGVGTIGRNGCLIVPGAGSYCFIGVILSTALIEVGSAKFIETSAPITDCAECGRCVGACPTGALAPEGYTLDARKCLSYLTIEHRGDFPVGTKLHGSFFGCDRCQAVCPHNRLPLPSRIAEFAPRPEIMTIRGAELERMTPEEFSARFRRSPMKRAKLAGLQRNLKQLG